jgi:hypothetical protein
MGMSTPVISNCLRKDIHRILLSELAQTVPHMPPDAGDRSQENSQRAFIMHSSCGWLCVHGTVTSIS